jgi:hypothetical protein
MEENELTVDDMNYADNSVRNRGLPIELDE